jgi:hypothetical protein
VCRLVSAARSHGVSLNNKGHNRRIVSRYAQSTCAHAFELARGGSGVWYAMELTELIPHVARALHINWDEATRYAGLTTES